MIARRNSGSSSSLIAALGAPSAHPRRADPHVADDERADGDADVSRGGDVRVPGARGGAARTGRGGSTGSPDMITVSAAGAVTVRSVSIASLVALSAGKSIMSSVCQPKPRSHASSGSAEPK